MPLCVKKLIKNAATHVMMHNLGKGITKKKTDSKLIASHVGFSI